MVWLRVDHDFPEDGVIREGLDEEHQTCIHLGLKYHGARLVRLQD